MNNLASGFPKGKMGLIFANISPYRLSMNAILHNLLADCNEIRLSTMGSEGHSSIFTDVCDEALFADCPVPEPASVMS